MTATERSRRHREAQREAKAAEESARAEQAAVEEAARRARLETDSRSVRELVLALDDAERRQALRLLVHGHNSRRDRAGIVLDAARRIRDALGDVEARQIGRLLTGEWDRKALVADIQENCRFLESGNGLILGRKKRH